MPQLSVRGIDMPASPIRKLVPLALEAERRGLRVLRLNIGQPDLPTPPEAFRALKEVDRSVLEYSPSDGLLSLRRKLADYYHRFGMPVAVDDIIVTCGGSEAVLFAFMACLNPGDEIIVPEPAYANYMAFAISAGARIVPLATDISSGFALPPAHRFEELITPRTRGILICNPNNPTGYIYSAHELQCLRDIVKRHDLYLFSDEVYREFCYTGQPCISAYSLEGIDDQVVLIDSVSKRYNECGIRIGALITRNAALRSVVMKFCQARLSPPLLGQLVAEASVDTPESYMRQVYDEYRRRRDFLIDGINSIPGCHTPMPMGAFYTLAELPVDDADRFCSWCLSHFSYRSATIFMAPGSGFYSDPAAGRRQVRLAYVLEIPALSEALDILRHALEAYPGRQPQA